MTVSGAVGSLPETTEIERRILAHERIIQSLIAYMSITEPRFVDHLRKRFVDPMKMTPHELDYKDVDDYAEEFIHAIMLIGDTSNTPVASKRTQHTIDKEKITIDNPQDFSSLPSDRIKLKETGGIWHVTVDGAFYGDFIKKEQALAAMALAKLSLR